MSGASWNGRAAAIAVACVVIAAAGTAIWLHPPSEARALALDRMRLERLADLDNALDAYYRVHNALPPRLETLRAGPNFVPDNYWHDPVIDRAFEYDVIGGDTYRLCAIFERASNEAEGISDKPHRAGRSCFENRVRPAR
jgi:type II secretory pathway pseudopilin PulG